MTGQTAASFVEGHWTETVAEAEAVAGVRLIAELWSALAQGLDETPGMLP
jgi:hypothetical protein